MSLASPEFLSQRSDQQLYEFLSASNGGGNRDGEGNGGRLCPPWGKTLKAGEIKQVASYIRLLPSLNREDPQKSSHKVAFTGLDNRLNWLIFGFFGVFIFSYPAYRMSRNLPVLWAIAVILMVVLGFAVGLLWAANPRRGSSEKEFTVQARRFAYNPAIIKVHKGDRVTLKLKSTDVTHGFYLDGYEIKEKIPAEEDTVISFVADKAGRFAYRCSNTCGVLHTFMIGNLIVEPNYLFPGSVGLAFGLSVGTMVYLYRKEED